MPIERSDIESKRFGIEIARTTDLSVSAEYLDRAAKALNIDMLITRIGSTDKAKLSDLQHRGHHLMDSIVTYQAAVFDSETGRNDTIVTRPATIGDLGAIEDISRAAFRNLGGHYHADPKLPSELSTEGYVEWACLSCKTATADKPVYVAETAGQTAGFLTMSKMSDDLYEIVLNAVHPDFQKRGVYTALLNSAFIAAHAANAKTLRVATQFDNMAPQIAWIRKGFLPVKSSHTFHKWYQ